MEHVIAAYKEHGVIYVSQFEWGGVLWRPLGHAEAELYSGLFQTVPKAKAELEEQIFHECVLDHPLPKEEFDKWKAGTVTTVAQTILFFSLIRTPNEFLQRLEAARNNINEDVFLQMFTRIIQVFPVYTIEQLRNMPIDCIMDRLAIAEVITGDEIKITQEQQHGSMASEFVDFAAENEKLRKADVETPAGDWNLHNRRNS